MSDSVYDLALPEGQSTAVVFASPHSGRDYSRAFLRQTVLSQRQIRSSEDAYLDQLYEAAPQFGAPFLQARTPRAYIDLNRGVEELDPAVVVGARGRHMNPRISSGLGIIPRVVANGQAIYRGKISADDARRRIANHWQPYHDQLDSLMQATRTRFGKAVLIDLHSMPREAAQPMGPGGRRADVILGDRYGASAASGIVERIEAAFASVGLRVMRNAPFAGAYIVQTYGKPLRGTHAVQVEINRALYMDEARVELRADFPAFQRLMTGVLAELAAIGRPDVALAAE